METTNLFVNSKLKVIRLAAMVVTENAEHLWDSASPLITDTVNIVTYSLMWVI